MVTTQATTQVKSCASSLDQSCDKKIALPIVSVSVSANDRVVKTRALLDPGSTRTFCARRLINQLDITGYDAEINLETLSDQKNIAASCVTLAIKGRNTKGKPILLHKVLAVDGFPKLESGIVSQEVVGQWDHLFDIVNQQDAGSDSSLNWARSSRYFEAPGDSTWRRSRAVCHQNHSGMDDKWTHRILQRCILY